MSPDLGTIPPAELLDIAQECEADARQYRKSAKDRKTPRDLREAYAIAARKNEVSAYCCRQMAKAKERKAEALSAFRARQQAARQQTLPLSQP